MSLPSITHPALPPFAHLAEQFCQLVDAHKGSDRSTFLGSVHRLLPQLYTAALALPETGVLFAKSSPDDDSGTSPSGEPLDTEGRAALHHSLSTLIGPEHDLYREVFNPYDPATEPEVVGLLSDDIADIYHDLRRGLEHWHRRETGEALWEWRFNFEHHWSEHATGALRAISALSRVFALNWPHEPGAA